MENTKFTKLVNYDKQTTRSANNKQLHRALDTLGDLLGIEFGSITIKFHDGKWCPKIQIEKRLMEEVKE